MVICFEEKDRKVIEAKGMTIIEFKRIMYRTEKCIENAWKVLREWSSTIADALNIFVEWFLEMVDGVKLAFEKIREAYHYPTSYR